jgi:hypothetical protein
MVTRNKWKELVVKDICWQVEMRGVIRDDMRGSLAPSFMNPGLITLMAPSISRTHDIPIGMSENGGERMYKNY